MGDPSPSPWRPSLVSRSYLDAAEAGADNGAIVAGGAAGTTLASHPEKVEGAAVAGALRAFAGGWGGGEEEKEGGLGRR